MALCTLLFERGEYHSTMTHRKWIQRAVKRKGSLTRWAKQHGFYHNGRIQLDKALRYAKRKHLTKRVRQINLAKTLSRLRRRKRS